MIDFLILALLCGIAVTLVTGPLGCFIVWRKMAYFGDTLAHSALVGVAIGLLAGIHPSLAVMLVSVLVGVLLLALQRRSGLANDTLLGILSHGSLALGLVIVSVFGDGKVDLYSYLFGDLLTVNWQDVTLTFGLSAIVLAVLVFFWSSLLRATLDEDLARVEGVATETMKALLIVLIAVVIAFAMRVVGVLLITALLIIPAATARFLSRSPERMAMVSSLVGALSVILGLAGSMSWDTPAGPSIVIAALLLFLIARTWGRKISKAL